jgi:hypothetical protein
VPVSVLSEVAASIRHMEFFYMEGQRSCSKEEEKEEEALYTKTVSD